MKKLLLTLCAVAALAACDDKQGEVTSSDAYMGGGARMEKMAVASAMVAPAPMAPGVSSDAALQESAPPSSMVMDRSQLGDRKIAETHNLSIETTFDVLQARYQRDFKKCVELGCQITNSNIALEQGGNLNARIAPEKLGEFLDFLATGEGKILNHQVSADDYTMEYSDTASQTENLMALRERLRTLLNSPKAEDVDGILRIESELNRVQTEIDSRTARLRILQKMTSMATVNLNYTVQYRPAEVKPYELNNTWSLAVQKFLRGIDAMIQFVGATLPWVPVFFIGLWLAVRVVRFAFTRVGTSFKFPWRKNQ